MSVGLTREKIAEAAVANGFGDLSLSAVARRLGVTHVALYRHVRDRADLGYVAVDLVAANLAWPSTDGDWATHLRAVGRILHDTFERHPGLHDEVIRLGTVPSFNRHIERTATHLLGQGFRPAQARLALEMVFHVVVDAARTVADEEPPTAHLEDAPTIVEWLETAPVPFDAKLDVLFAGFTAMIDDPT
ncbi:MAG: hypothetical protein AAGA93_22290 [Actinomycetota bacterium]